MKKWVAANDGRLLGYRNNLTTAEELDSVIAYSGENGQEGRFDGRRHPFAVLSSQPHYLRLLRQQFAQVTNPPIDPRSACYRSPPALAANERLCEAGTTHRLSFKSPILLTPISNSYDDERDHYRADTLDITFDVTKTTLERR